MKRGITEAMRVYRENMENFKRVREMLKGPDERKQWRLEHFDAVTKAYWIVDSITDETSKRQLFERVVDDVFYNEVEIQQQRELTGADFDAVLVDALINFNWPGLT